MPAVMSPNPKRVREFILNGRIYAGGIEEAYAAENAARHNLGGNGSTNGVLQENGGEKKEN